MNIQSIGELVRKNEDNYINKSTTISKYVDYSMYDVIETIYAYLNSVHTSGKFDSLGREKPFFNIVTAVANIWFRATDIDRSNIKLTSTKVKDWVDTLLANVLFQNWMKQEFFASFLNEWGRVLSRYGSAVIETVENSTGLHVSVISWHRFICDPVNFDDNPKIKILELTESQLRQNEKYDQTKVKELLEAKETRETMDKRRKDNKSDYYRIYEVHGSLSKQLLTDDEKDADIFVQQMHAISFVGGKKRGKDEYTDFTLYRGEEKEDPFMLTHLIPEDERTLSIGAVENLFTAQWMMNYTAKAMKDQLDLASKLFYQTADPNFLGQNVVDNIENGDILIHAFNQPLTQVNNGSHDITSLQNFAVQWKDLANEISGISEAMLGASPKSGTAWRQTEALLQESYNLFEVMTENKGNYLDKWLRKYGLPYFKKQMDSKDEVSAILKQHDIDKIDGIYIKNMTVKAVNDKIIDLVKSGKRVTQEQQNLMLAQGESDIKESLSRLGNNRFFAPDEIDDATWKAQFKDIEWDLDIDITGEQKNSQEALATLNTALQVIMNPAYEQNPKAKRVVGKILELTGTMSQLELDAIPTPQIQPIVSDGSNAVGGEGLPNNQTQ